MRTRGQNGVIFVVFWTYLKSKSELQVGQCKQVDVVMPHLVDRGSFRDNLNHVIAVSHRLNFKSQNQSLAHTCPRRLPHANRISVRLYCWGYKPPEVCR